MALSRDHAESPRKWRWWKPALVFFVILLLGYGAFQFLAFTQHDRDHAFVQATNNAKQIYMLLVDFEQDYGRLPDASTAPLLEGTTRFDRTIFHGRAVILRADNSMKELTIAEDGHIYENGMDLFDPRQPYWGGAKPPSSPIPNKPRPCYHNLRRMHRPLHCPSLRRIRARKAAGS